MRSARAAFIVKGSGEEGQAAARGLGALSLSDVVDNVKVAATTAGTDEGGGDGSQSSQAAKPSLLRSGSSKFFKQIAKKAVVEDVVEKQQSKASILVPPFLGYVRIHEKKYAYQIGQLSIMLREARGLFESVERRLEDVRAGLSDTVNKNHNLSSVHSHIHPLTALEASQSLQAIIEDMDEKVDWLFDSDLARAKFEQTYGVVSNPAKITASTMLGKAYEDVAEDAKSKHPEDVSFIAATVAGDLRYQAMICGGWKNVLYKMDGSLDMQMSLDNWSDADKVEILSLMLQSSKQETAAAVKQAEAGKASLEEVIAKLSGQVSELHEWNLSLVDKNLDEERRLAEDKVARLSWGLGQLEAGVHHAIGLLRSAAGGKGGEGGGGEGGLLASPRRTPSLVAVSALLGSPPSHSVGRRRGRSPGVDDEVDCAQREGSILNVSPHRNHETYVPVKVAHKPSSTPDMITFSKPAVLLEPLRRSRGRPSTTATRRKQKIGHDKIDALLSQRQQAALASRRFETAASFSEGLPFIGPSYASASAQSADLNDELFSPSGSVEALGATRVEALIKSLQSACKDVSDRILFSSDSGDGPVANAQQREVGAGGGSVHDAGSVPLGRIKASDILLRAHVINHEISAHIQQSKRLDGMLKEITRNYQVQIAPEVGERRILLSRK